MAEFDGSRVVVGAGSGIGRAVADLARSSSAWVLGLSRADPTPQGATGISTAARRFTKNGMRTK
jgi:NAD(P)-dependent dehydrogenase (short-subunit alcohol dehydrogenase family)